MMLTDLLRAECMLRAESINRIPLEASKPATGRRCYYPVPMISDLMVICNVRL